MCCLDPLWLHLKHCPAHVYPPQIRRNVHCTPVLLVLRRHTPSIHSHDGPHKFPGLFQACYLAHQGIVRGLGENVLPLWVLPEERLKRLKVANGHGIVNRFWLLPRGFLFAALHALLLLLLLLVLDAFAGRILGDSSSSRHVLFEGMDDCCSRCIGRLFETHTWCVSNLHCEGRLWWR